MDDRSPTFAIINEKEQEILKKKYSYETVRIFLLLLFLLCRKL